MKKTSFNFNSLIGMAVAISVVYLGGIKGVKNPAMFLDSHALILVIGGTLAATLLAYPFSSLTCSQVLIQILRDMFKINISLVR